MQKLITEFIGTFCLCLVIALNANAGIANLIAIGSLLTGIIYAGGHISGAHYNPAVTLAFLMSGHIKIRQSLEYVLSQVLAAIAAALTAQFLFGISGNGTGALSELGAKAALGAEVIGTFILVFVILNVAIAKGTAGNEFYGIAIGLTVVGGGYVFGKYSGAAFNPAVAVSQSILRFFSWADAWIYLVGCFGGGALGAIVYRFLNPDDKK